MFLHKTEHKKIKKIKRTEYKLKWERERVKEGKEGRKEGR